MRKPILSGAVYLPRSEFNAALRKRLTVEVYTPGEEEARIVQAWSEDKAGYVGIPRYFGLSYLGLDHKDEISPGYELPEDQLQPIALYDYQTPWVEGIVDKARFMYDFRAMAATGKGKTVMSLEVIRRIRATALIIVDQEFLRDQWIDQAQKFLGIPRDKIGIIQGKKCEIDGKWLVIAMIQTLYQNVYDEEVYDYFGTVIVDEAHVAGAPMFSRALLQFRAQNRIGISATPKRGDSLDKILEWNLGPVAVTLEAKHQKSVVRYIESYGVYSWYANISPKTGRFISELIDDAQRNALICEAIVWLWESGRDVLAVGERIEHLEALMAFCYYLGVPEDEMGIVSGYTHRWAYLKDPEPKRKPLHLEPGASYTPVKLQQVKTRTPKKVLDTVKQTKRIIFATYGMFTKGVDVPRLSAGIDCTPRSKAQQVHGRILRALAGKKRPIWVTIRDVNSFRAEHQFGQRIDEYVKSNAEIFRWRIGRGIKQVDHLELRAEARRCCEELKSRVIEIAQDGRNIVTTQTIEKR
jgi:superfamily II DNA or RNA helicase